MFDLDSPESFDEVFFSTYSSNQIKEDFENYVNLILLSQKKQRYLSKNNLNYKRINLIKSIFPNSVFLIPIRYPLIMRNLYLNNIKILLIFKNKMTSLEDI